METSNEFNSQQWSPLQLSSSKLIPLLKPISYRILHPIEYILYPTDIGFYKSYIPFYMFYQLWSPHYKKDSF